MNENLVPKTLNYQLMLKFIFRLALVLTGLFLFFLAGRGFYLPIQYQSSGASVTGKVIGFYGRTGSILQEKRSSGHKRRVQKPVVRYPSGQGDSLNIARKGGAPLLFATYDLGDEVKVVYPQGQPELGRLADSREWLGWGLIALVGLVCCWVGLARRL